MTWYDIIWYTFRTSGEHTYVWDDAPMFDIQHTMIAAETIWNRFFFLNSNLLLTYLVDGKASETH